MNVKVDKICIQAQIRFLFLENYPGIFGLLEKGVGGPMLSANLLITSKSVLNPKTPKASGAKKEM